MKNRLVLALLALLLSSCAQTRSGAVRPISFSSSVLSHLDGQTIRVAVVDTRPKQEGSDNPLPVILNTLRTANPRATWVLEADESGADLTIKVAVFESTFSLGNWTGNVTFEVGQRVQREQPVQFTVQRLVTLSNMLGYKTADDALQKAFEQAMSELIAKL